MSQHGTVVISSSSSSNTVTLLHPLSFLVASGGRPHQPPQDDAMRAEATLPEYSHTAISDMLNSPPYH